MKTMLGRIFFLALAAILAAGAMSVVTKAVTFESGQRTYGKLEVEPALNDANGNILYLLSPLKNPFPSKADTNATAPFYMPLYPVSSTVPASNLNCQPTNCDHANVLPFADVDYGALPGTAQACVDFNGGQPCSPVEGHDHLVGIPPRGDYNVPWHVILAVFTHTAFQDGKINQRITTLSQLQALKNSGDVIFVDSGISFNCSMISETTYNLGTPVVIPFP